jgi:hypothetical protein
VRRTGKDSLVTGVAVPVLWQHTMGYAGHVESWRCRAALRSRHPMVCIRSRPPGTLVACWGAAGWAARGHPALIHLYLFACQRAAPCVPYGTMWHCWATYHKAQPHPLRLRCLTLHVTLCRPHAAAHGRGNGHHHHLPECTLGPLCGAECGHVDISLIGLLVLLQASAVVGTSLAGLGWAALSERLDA